MRRIALIALALTSAMNGCGGGSTPPSVVGYVRGTGQAFDVAVDAANHVAYVASYEFGLSVVDITDPANPQVVGTSNVPFIGEAVAFSGTTAVVSDTTSTVRVLDVSQRSAPRVVATMPGVFRNVAMSGHFAYLLQTIPGNPSHADLVVVDLTAPANPQTVGRRTLGGGRDIVVSANRAYVAAEYAGLQVVDVSTPSAPAILGTVDTPNLASGVDVSGTTAYVADGNAVFVMDVATPTAPRVRGSLSQPAYSVAATTGRIYTATSNTFSTIDVSTPTSPILRSSVSGYSPNSLAAYGSHALLAASAPDAQGRRGLYVMDMSSPATPTLAGNAYGGFMNASDVAVSGSVAGVVAGANGLRVLDVTNPAAPQVRSTLATTGSFVSIAMARTTAYVVEIVPGNPARTDIDVVDLSTPANPRIVGRGTVSTTGNGTVANIVVAGTRAYVALGLAGLAVVDVSTTTPTVLGTVDTPGDAHSVVVSGSYAYVADTTAMRVVNVTVPTAPTIVGTANVPALSVALQGTRAFTVNGLDKFTTVDVTSPTAPAEIAHVNAFGARHVAVIGTQAFLVTPGNHGDSPTPGVYVFDVAGASPTLRVSLATPGVAGGIAGDGTRAYVGDSASVLDVIG